MAELRVGGRAKEPATATPWASTLTLAWSRPGERPRRIRVDGAEVPVQAASPQVLPWLDARVDWEDDRGAHSARISVDPAARPEQARLEVLRGFARTVRRLEALDITNASFLPLFSATQLWHWLEPAPLDDEIARHLGPLADACARPRSWLREEHVVQPVGRVRRPSRDAIRHLARHPEHAGTDGLRVYPERILASVPEEELDIYENRVLVGLVRRLLLRAHRNARRVDLALAELDQLRADMDRAHRFAQYRRHGLLKQQIEGQHGDLAAILNRGESVKHKLRLQIRTLEACLQSAVGKELRLTPVPNTPLRETNILTWDPRYRVLPLLWKALDEEEATSRSPLDLELDDPELAWFDFCHLALLRSLVELGFSGAGPITTRIGGGDGATEELRLEHPAGDWLADVYIRGSAIVLGLQRQRAESAPARRKGAKGPGQVVADSRSTRPQRTELRFVPTFCGPGARPAAAGPTDIWLHPHPLADLEGGDWADGWDRSWVHGRWPRAIAIAPWSFGSVDRLGRLLQVETLGAELIAGEVRERCPSCAAPGIRGREDSDRECPNSQCGARWGYRTCSPSCGARVPKLMPHLPSNDQLLELVLEHTEPHERLLLAEQLGGRDLLADWCLDDEGVGSFWMVCPSCGRCGNPKCSSAACAGQAAKASSSRSA